MKDGLAIHFQKSQDWTIRGICGHKSYIFQVAPPFHFVIAISALQNWQYGVT